MSLTCYVALQGNVDSVSEVQSVNLYLLLSNQIRIFMDSHLNVMVPYIYGAGIEVGIVTGYWLDNRGVGVRVPAKSRIFSSPRRPDQLWGPTNILPVGTVGSFPGNKVAGA
jgi:hypothetical protein